MLQKLRVKNVVLIAEAEIEFLDGLNVLSGETGAGKSIVVDCLMLLFGNRYDKTLLRYGEEDGFVEGVFLLGDRQRVVMEEMGFEGDEVAVIKRRFSKDGKSDIRINGMTATASMLRRLMATLIDIYVQHDFLRLNNPAAQLAVLDYYDRQNQAQILGQLAEKCAAFGDIKAQLSDLGDAGDRDKEIDFLKYQIAEIKSSGVFRGEEDELVDRRKKALNIEKITSALGEVVGAIEQSELSRGAAALSKIEAFDQDFPAFFARINAAVIELDDLCAAVRGKLEDAKGESFDMDALEDRLAFLRVLGKKYGDFDRMNEFCDKAEQRLAMLESCDTLYAELSAKRAKLVGEIYSLSEKLSKSRQAAALEFCKKIEVELSQLGMENSEFKIVFADLPSQADCEKYISKSGMDSIEFHLSPNAGQPTLPLAKIISGGEMSRFMLALKVVTGDSDKIPTLIFDEIDAGISGLVGREVAKKLARISAGCQVLCVTHLPQIAAMADNHLYVKKEIVGGGTVTNLRRLDKDGMIGEISRLFGGMGISESSHKSAAEIKDWCDGFKKSLAGEGQ